ncbi:hypothetical protein OS242_02095 [Tumebacillus sp. DT12]|uniref:DUF4363 domain-containing protein n=1 Tax=Tumebacillus lacus TaxID=2995335 RepID=A0ABT3WZ26_9BACL|nr:hypothetical protein [Tumebacillus lacus]MCX7568762.1 hypothetical protein [Tumebacillus lacus]
MKRTTIALSVVCVVLLLFSMQTYRQHQQLKDQIVTLQSIQLEQVARHTQNLREVVQKLAVATAVAEREGLHEKALHETAAIKYTYEAYAASAIPAGTRVLERTHDVADQFRQVWTWISGDLEEKTPTELHEIAERLQTAEEVFKK